MDSLSKVLKTTLVFIAAIVGMLLCACHAETPQLGTVEGTVTIGPIWPVERPGEKPPVPPEVFDARKVMIYDKRGTRLIQKVDLVQIDQGQEGYYRIQLKPGTYIVDINHVGIDTSSDIPTEIEVRPEETVQVNIDIDTGIR